MQERKVWNCDALAAMQRLVQAVSSEYNSARAHNVRPSIDLELYFSPHTCARGLQYGVQIPP